MEAVTKESVQYCGSRRLIAVGQRGEKEDLTGQKFNSLLVLGEAASRWESGRIRYYWRCQCDCGYIFEVRGAALKHGSPSACFDCSRRTTGLKLRKNKDA